MNLIARQFSGEVALAQDGRLLDERGCALLTSIAGHVFPPALANTGLVVSTDEDGRTQAIVHGKTLSALRDHILWKNNGNALSLFGRIAFAVEEDGDNKVTRKVTILHDERGNAGLFEGDPESFYLHSNLNEKHSSDELFRKVGVALVGAAQGALEVIGK